MEFLKAPWPWYVVGPLIGAIVPLMLWIGNKSFGLSSNFRHICSICLPLNIPFLNYDWKKDKWNLWFIAGIPIGSFLAYWVFGHTDSVALAEATVRDLGAYGITLTSGLAPKELFSLSALGSWQGWVFIALGGFLVGFGSRFAGGCTSGHAITGLANLQWGSLIVVIGFFIGGLIATFLIYPLLF